MSLEFYVIVTGFVVACIGMYAERWNVERRLRLLRKLETGIIATRRETAAITAQINHLIEQRGEEQN